MAPCRHPARPLFLHSDSIRRTKGRTFGSMQGTFSGRRKRKPYVNQGAFLASCLASASVEQDGVFSAGRMGGNAPICALRDAKKLITTS